MIVAAADDWEDLTDRGRSLLHACITWGPQFHNDSYYQAQCRGLVVHAKLGDIGWAYVHTKRGFDAWNSQHKSATDEPAEVGS